MDELSLPGKLSGLGLQFGCASAAAAAEADSSLPSEDSPSGNRLNTEDTFGGAGTRL
jgi:hypothetical protein